MPEKITVDAFNYIGGKVATCAIDECGIKFNQRQRSMMIARLTANFTGGAATALKMLDDGHDLSDLKALTKEVQDGITNRLQ
jgi:hypothetical protein